MFLTHIYLQHPVAGRQSSNHTWSSMLRGSSTPVRFECSIPGMLVLLLVLSALGCGSCSTPDVDCVIMNLEYLNCTWSSGSVPEFNYTFSTRSHPNTTYNNCPRYLQEGGLNVGCISPAPNKFYDLHIKLFHGNGSLVMENTLRLQNSVKLNPPHNLSVEMNTQNQELWLYWNHSVKENCRENQVTYKKSSELDWQFSTLFPANYYSLPQVSLKSQYELKVRTRVSRSCGESKFWSDWSSPVFCSPAEWINTTGSPSVTPSGKMLFPVMGVGAAVLLLIAMGVLLVQAERLRIILIPVVPNPGKNFEDLLKTYNGNVDDWLDIPKEFKNGFQSNYYETACPVRECSPVSRATDDGGGDENRPPETEQSEHLEALDSQPAVSTSSLNVPPGLV